MKKVLIVDDDITIQRLLEFILRKFDVDVLISGDGDSAIELIKSEKPDLVFLDVMMPGKNGIEVCREIKANPELKDTYIVMLTAKGEESEIKDMFDSGANEYVPKPFSPSEIMSIVKKVIYKE
ncbi:response regulator transcription factor [Candidatus Chrysopegis kryptomonas]|jgi:DNA-binding response OmpR family regulator|uniref:Response regulator receiver domain-containing protein n=1 Tax=Candidatus Chryseopegocella kryptomonas TaxID=1633643 RepID=A0A0N7MXW2_9BACT|nr:response regulator [Candidatus Chrysopegis kryptomonas]CUT02555.1 Response regulator receiver domain-containing protein [Candidatus Chrysopegis kryptomonas]